MSKAMIVVGFGPGTATAVAEKFGARGFTLALVGRSEERLAAGVEALKKKGIVATAFPADAGDPDAIRATIRSVRSQLGPITVLHWNLYGGLDAGDLLAVGDASLHHIFDAPVFGLIAAAGELLSDLKQNTGAILVSNGALSEVSDAMDAVSAQNKFMGLALSGAAKQKLAGLLGQRLKGDGIYVGEVVVHGSIKGTPGAAGNAIDPAVIADKYWELYEARNQTRIAVT